MYRDTSSVDCALYYALSADNNAAHVLPVKYLTTSHYLI